MADVPPPYHPVPHRLFTLRVVLLALLATTLSILAAYGMGVLIVTYGDTWMLSLANQAR